MASPSHMSDEHVDENLDALRALLPPSLREGWAVVPKRLFTKLYVVGAVHGAGAALLIVGLWLGIPQLLWVYPISFVLLVLLTKSLPWWREDRELIELERACEELGDRGQGA
ncbi:MAG: hypothetical protein P1V81_03550 [Planctomycetota bacterium]|nr:hypothetical protein [Planctomycetota bacterium]